MPAPRPKSCDACRLAKARCTLSVPCIRCSKRGVDCRYSTAVVRRQTDQNQGLRPLRPAPGVDCGLSENDSFAYKPAPSLEISSTSSPNGYTSFSAIGDHAAEVHDALSLPICENAPLPYVYVPPDFVPEAFDLPDSLDISAFIFDFQTTPPSSEDFDEKDEAELVQRSRSFQQGALTAKMIYSKLASYCHLLADAIHLPPFIHPPCWLGASDRCAADAPHRCLPEPLAVCSNLLQMFSMRREGTEGFVWKQICTHLRELQDNVRCARNVRQFHTDRA